MAQNIKQKIAKNLKNFRESLSLSQDDFAEKIGLSKDTIGKIEKSKSSLTLNVLSKIVSTFNVKPAYFYPFENAQFSDSKTEKIEAISENLKNFDDNELILINEMINSLKKYNERKNA